MRGSSRAESRPPLAGCCVDLRQIGTLVPVGVNRRPEGRLIATIRPPDDLPRTLRKPDSLRRNLRASLRISVNSPACMCEMFTPTAGPHPMTWLEEIRDTLEARIIEAKRECWLGEAGGLQIRYSGRRRENCVDRQPSSSALPQQSTSVCQCSTPFRSTIAAQRHPLACRIPYRGVREPIDIRLRLN